MGRRSRDTGLPNEWLGEWIGRWVNGSGAQVIRLRLDAGGADSEHPITGTLDLPGALRFGRIVRGWWRTSSDVFADRLTVDLGGESATAERQNDQLLLRTGTRRVVRLQRSEPLDSEAIQAWMGEYAGGGRTVVVGMFADDDLGQPFAYYAEDSLVVRLYPLRAGRFLSERGEIVVFRDYGRRAGRYLTIQRDGNGRQVELSRRASPVEQTIRFRATGSDGEFVLAGTLLKPAGHDPRPAVVCLHGATGGQRDLYRMYAHPLVRAGVAVLLFDKPGHGESSGPDNPTIFDQANAVHAALDYLQSRDDIDSERIGLWGISNGMWVAPMVAAVRSDVAFIAGVGSPGVSMASQEVYRRTRALSDAGVSAGTVAKVSRTWTLIFSVAATGRADDDLVSELDLLLKELADVGELHDYPVPDYAMVEPMLSPVPPAISARDLAARLTGTPDPEFGHDPIASYRRVGCPVFLQWGEGELNVPVEESVTRISAALTRAGNTNVAMTVYPGAGHMLDVVPDSVDGLSVEQAEYHLHGFRFAPGAIEDLTTWISDHTIR